MSSMGFANQHLPLVAAFTLLVGSAAMNFWARSACRWQVFKRAVTHFVREDDESMKPPSNVKTPAQYIASLPADRAKTIATVRALVNKHIPRGYDECLVWGTIGWTI